MGMLGLRSVNMHFKRPGYGPGALSHAMEHINQFFNINQHNPQLYYTFGWSGLATTSARAEAGIGLYKALADLTQELRGRGINFTLQLYGYSHGGNVVLSVAHGAPKNPPFTIDRAILLGMPVQCETDYLCQHAIFKTIYHLYSRSDFVPAMDCFSFKRFFSSTVFQSRPNFILPNKLYQIQLRITDTLNTHRSYRNIDQQLASFITGNARFLRDRSPNHTELWFFEWTPYGYRSRSPLRPFCLAAFIPYIVHYLEQANISFDPEIPTVVDLRPYYQETIIRPLYQVDPVAVFPFASAQEIAKLAYSLQPFWTDRMTLERYNRHIQHAINLAHEQIKQEQKRQSTAQNQWARWNIPFWN